MSARRWDCWGPWCAGASHLYTEPGTVGGHPAELGVRRGEERGGQDARSRVRPSLTSSKGTGGGGAGVNPGTASRPGCQRREWGWSRGGAGRGSSALPPLRLCSSQSFGCHTRFRRRLPVNAPFGPYFCTRGNVCCAGALSRRISSSPSSLTLRPFSQLSLRQVPLSSHAKEEGDLSRRGK